MARIVAPAKPVSIVALDYSNSADALALVARLGSRCRFYKIGNELFTAAGPDVVRRVRDAGADVFLDLKFHDIPNTVTGGVRSAVALGARLTTVHATGGAAMLAAAVDAAGDSCGVLGVTILTSLNAADVASSWGRDASQLNAIDEVVRLASIVFESGAHGIVCSGLEAAAVRKRHGSGLALLIPGVRQAGGSANDQARIVTPSGAVEAGASYLVLGRAVTAAADPVSALEQIDLEIAAATC